MKNSIPYVVLATVLGMIHPMPAHSQELEPAFAQLRAQVVGQMKTVRADLEREEIERTRLVSVESADAGWDRKIALTPTVAIYSGPRLDDTLPTFREKSDGTYVIDLMIVARHSTKYSQDHWTSLYFDLSHGKIVRDGNALVYVEGADRITVAETKWWYEPKWYLTKNARVHFAWKRAGDTYEISGVELDIRHAEHR